MGTLADAWQPCPLLKFEGKLPDNEDTLTARAESTHQSGSNESQKILQILKMWRDKYLAADKKGVAPHDLERLRNTVEALRAKAYLLYLRENAKKVFPGANQMVSLLLGAPPPTVGWFRL